MPITKVQGVGLGGGDSEGDSRRWRRFEWHVNR